jgi:hypothetical protein
MHLIKRGLVAGTSVALMLVSTGAAFAGNQFLNSNTGADSRNIIDASKSCSSYTRQSSSSSVANGISLAIDTGNNEANKNSNSGSSSIMTGGITFGVGVLNGGNTNVIESDGCCCGPDHDDEIIIAADAGPGEVEAINEDTGADSTNKITIRDRSSTSRRQSSYSRTRNWLDIWARTGGNETNKNSAGTDTTVDTGDVDGVVEVINEGNTNLLP